MNREYVERVVAETLDNLAVEFGQNIHNVVVVVEEWPTEEQLRSGNVGRGMTLFGLYQGIPLTKRGNYSSVLPDKITIFAGPILSAHRNDINGINEQIRNTVIHELGHYFGMNEEEIRSAQKH